VLFIQQSGPGIYLRTSTARIRNLPGMDLPLPPGKKWLKLDLSGTPEARQDLMSDPSALLGQLRTIAKVSSVGDERVDGLTLHHYALEIDVARQIDQLRSEGRFLEADDFQELVDTHGARAEVPADVWIGPDGLVHRYRAPLSAGTTGSEQTDFYAFGHAPQTAIPPSSKTYDGSALFKAQL
jgi:hypothetical protein